jgi:hypothetical protein
MLQFGPIFEILTFDFDAKFSKMSMFFKSPISQDPLIGKFQNWVEMKVNYPNNIFGYLPKWIFPTTFVT